MNTRFGLKGLMLALCLAGMGSALAADGSDMTLAAQVTMMDQMTTTVEPTKVTTKFASDFAAFAGSRENAEALIGGLRNGTPITLTGTTATTTAATTLTITPPTKPMGYGNTYISMSLAKAQLAQSGIVDPTPEELQAALTGGSFTVTTVGPNGMTTTKTVTSEGILMQRASGMGWGEIAKANGFKLGAVISGMKSANKSLAPMRTTSGTTATAGATGAKATKVKAAAYTGKSQTHTRMTSSTRGITTALGGGGIVYGNAKGPTKSVTHMASINGRGTGGTGHGQSAGIASASGGGSVSHGNSGSAPGHSKGPK